MEKIDLLGFHFWNALSSREVVDVILQDNFFDHSGKIKYLITPNAYDISQYHGRYRSLYPRFRDASIVLADGGPIVWLSGLYGKKLRRRITGSDLFPVLWQRIRQEKKSVCFILPSRELEQHLTKEDEKCYCMFPGYFDPDDGSYIRSFVDVHFEKIVAHRPAFIFIGLSMPKQQRMALELFDRMSGKVDFNCTIALLGASFEYYLGFKKRAPGIFQRSGTEWLFRLANEPRRLWKRYTIGNIRFAFVALQYLIGKKHRTGSG